MKKTLGTGIGLLVIAAGVVLATTSSDAQAGRGDGPIIYVTGQGLFYDSIVTADPLPARGKFQKLEMGGPSPNGLQTEFGPGDRGYRGGRWWLDINGDGEMNEGDKFFSCPLLGPGREEA